MNPDTMMEVVKTWLYWLLPRKLKYNPNEPMIPRKFWVDENNNRLFPELQVISDKEYIRNMQ